MNQVPKIVLDTNAALDALLFKDSRIAPLMQQVRAGKLGWIACPLMRTELANVLARPMLQKNAPNHPALMAEFDALVALQDEPPCLAPALSSLRCRDSDDQVFIDLALHCGASWLISRDRDLLSLARHALRHGLAILGPENWQTPTAWSSLR